MADIRICSIPDCGKPVKGHGYCERHRHRFHKYGDPLSGRADSGALLRWIIDHSSFSGEDCLTWPFLSRYANGYGSLRFEGKQQVASRVMCQVAHGNPPTPKHQAAHSCGKGHLGCMNPVHLHWATPSENQYERVDHGTSNRGERHGASILNENLVREIRRLKPGRTAKEVSALTGVSPENVSHVVNRQRWAWVE